MNLSKLFQELSLYGQTTLSSYKDLSGLCWYSASLILPHNGRFYSSDTAFPSPELALKHVLTKLKQAMQDLT
jgi:hypothetical protein